MQPQPLPPKYKATPGEMLAIAALVIVGMVLTSIASFNTGLWAGLLLMGGFTWIGNIILKGRSPSLRKPFTWSKQTADKGSYHALGVGFIWFLGVSLFVKLLVGPTSSAPATLISTTSQSSMTEESIASSGDTPTPTEKGADPKTTATATATTKPTLTEKAATPRPTKTAVPSPTEKPAPTAEPSPTPEPSATLPPTATPKPSGTIATGGNFRSEPVVDAYSSIGQISVGDEVEFIELREGNGERWYKVRITKKAGADGMPIDTVGWISALLVDEPSGPVAVSTVPLPTARPAPTAMPQPTAAAAPPAAPPAGGGHRYDPYGPDVDCGHFWSYEEAYAFFIAAGGPYSDPHRLDGNNDGIPCENLR